MSEPRHEKNLKLVNGRWISDITFNGKRTRRDLGPWIGPARNALAKMRLDSVNERLGLKRPDNGEGVPFKAFATSIIETSKKQGKRSWSRDEISLAHLSAFFKDKTLRDIGPEGVEEYKATRRGEVSASTVNRELAFLKSVINKAVRFGKIARNPIADVAKFKENNARERILEPEEARRLVECANPMVRPILVVALNTGMRRNEILSLRWPDVNFSKGFLNITTSKSGKPRIIPMNEAVREALRGLRREPEAEFVFWNPETRDRYKDIRTGFATAKERAEIKGGLRLHDLRHTAASKMIEAGVDLVTVSKILGHSSIQMTMRYAHPTPENMRRAVERLGEALNPSRQNTANAPEEPSKAASVSDYKHYH